MPSEWNGYAGYADGQLPYANPHLVQFDPSKPSYLEVLFGQVRKRWKLLVLWLLLTAGVATFVLTNFTKPMWKAEGTLYYSPNFSMTNPLYRPPNIQTVLAMTKSPEIQDEVGKDYGLTAAELQNKLNVQIVKQSDMIAVSFESPWREKAEAVANRVMQLAIEQHDALRRKLAEPAIANLDRDLKKAFEDELNKRKELNDMLGNEHVYDLNTERSSLISEITFLENQLSESERQKLALATKIKATDNEIKRIEDESKDPKKKLSEADLSRLREIQDLKNKLSTRLEEVGKAKVKLAEAERKRTQFLELYRKGYMTKTEMGELERDIQAERVAVNEGTKAIDQMQKAIQKFEDSEAIPDTLKQAKHDRSKLEVDLSPLPGQIGELKAQLEKYVKRQERLRTVEKSALGKQQEIETLQQRRIKLTAQKQEHEKLEANEMAELMLRSPATAGDAPASSNRMKLGAGTFALSMLIFLSCIALFDMPRQAPAAPAPTRPVFPVPPQLPVPVWDHGPPAPLPNGSHAGRGLNVNNDQLRHLAERIAAGTNERGKIVLFTPTSKGLRLENLLGDLGCFLAKVNSKVLIFEARTQAENPSYPAWTGSNSRDVATELECYLDGRTERTGTCFAETLLSNIDYARGDLTQLLQGVMAMYRFRRLMSDMKERYSLVLMITPERYQGEEDDVFTTLGEGIVVVVNQDADPVDVEAYLRELSASATPVYGAFTIPLGASS